MDLADGFKGNPIPTMEIIFPVTPRKRQWPGCSSLHCEWFEKAAHCRYLVFGNTKLCLGH